MTVLRSLIDRWIGLLTARPGTFFVLTLLLAVLSAWGASRLTINTNQLDLISQDLRQVKDVKRVVDMIGGAGHLILALRGKDAEVLKAASDDINTFLKADKAEVRAVTYKVPAEFLRQHGALFMETADLIELRKRVMAKLHDVIKRASPFYIEIRPTPPVKLEVKDIIDKYTSVGKKSIVDDYYVSSDREMMLLLIKPMWDSTKLDETGALVQHIRTWLSTYKPAPLAKEDRKNGDPKVKEEGSEGHKARAEAEAKYKLKTGVRFVENYDRTPNPDPKVIEYGFTGSYQTNYDDSFEMKKSLVPVSGLALGGVFLVLMLFFRRRVLAVVLVITGLLLGVVFTMGFARLAVGQLNMITGILTGILFGLGIDFGIHMIIRLSEELDDGKPLNKALAETLQNSGLASLVSGLGTTAAFFSLLFSEFAGFSQFGLLAGVGVMIIGTTMYAWIPINLILINRRWPGAAKRLIGGVLLKNKNRTKLQRFPRAALVLGFAVLAALILTAKAPNVGFEYNTRALMVENQPSVMLQDEINARYQISADPVAVYTPTLEATRAVYDHFTPLDPKKHSTVDQLVSIFTMIPDQARQQRNFKILKDWNKELKEIDRKSLPPEFDEKWNQAIKYLQPKPFDVDDLPPHLHRLFVSLKTAKPENQGFLTFIYPVVDLWDGKQMLKFADEVEDIHTASGETYHAAGSPILFAKLARIVLFDGKFSVGLTAVLLLLILLIDLRSIRSTAVALLPLLLGVGMMLGTMAQLDLQLNFMNIVVFPIVLGYGLSHGVYLIHRYREGASAMEALRSVGTAVACSTLTTLAGWAALLAASHRGLKSMGMLACFGMTATLIVTFLIMPALLQLLHDRRERKMRKA